MSTKSDASLRNATIAALISRGAVVLDLGCGEGDLMARLAAEKRVRAQGIDKDEQAIYRCVSRGLSVCHGDLDRGLADYPDRAFDFVVLNYSFQQVRQPEKVLGEALRVGAKVIVAFPNFAHYSVRYQIALRGRTPVNLALPYQWYDTPNLHFLSISDFIRFCGERKISVEKARYISGNREVRLFPNLLAMTGVFLISSH